MERFVLLSAIFWLPLIGAAAVFCIRGEERLVARNAGNVALWVAFVTACVVMFVAFRFYGSSVVFYYDMKHLPSLEEECERFVVNALSVPFLCLNALSSLAAVWAVKRKTVTTRSALVMILLIESFLSGVLFSDDLFVFFLFYEGAFIPLFLLTAVYGVLKDDRTFVKQCVYFFVSGALFLFGALYLLAQEGRLDFQALIQGRRSMADQALCAVLFLPSFFIALPVFPFNGWFRRVQSNGPSALTAVISGMLPVVALYGLFAVYLSFCPDFATAAAPYLTVLAAFSALCAAKKTIKMKSVRKRLTDIHTVLTGVVCAALFSAERSVVTASLSFFIMHGVVFIAALLVLQVYFNRVRTNEEVKGLMSDMPFLGTAVFFVLCCDAAVPATPVFMPLFLTTGLLFAVSKTAAIMAGVAAVVVFLTTLTACYRLMSGERPAAVFPYLDVGMTGKIVLVCLVPCLFFLTVKYDVFAPYVGAAVATRW